MLCSEEAVTYLTRQNYIKIVNERYEKVSEISEAISNKHFLLTTGTRLGYAKQPHEKGDRFVNISYYSPYYPCTLQLGSNKDLLSTE